jgi:hypothetical protein
MFLTSRRCTSVATKAGVGMSRLHNPNVAGREAAEQALEKAGLSRPDFVLMFGSIGYDQHSLVREVREGETYSEQVVDFALSILLPTVST